MRGWSEGHKSWGLEHARHSFARGEACSRAQARSDFGRAEGVGGITQSRARPRRVRASGAHRSFHADFACREARLVVEIDGATHSTERELAYDKARENFIRTQGYRIVRFTNEEVYEQSDRVFNAIFAALEEGCG